MQRVYLSGPITKGNGTSNFAMAAEAQKRLMEDGFAVLNPMLSMMHPDARNISWHLWISSDLKFVEVSDMVVRLPGESKGADEEVLHAEKHGINIVLAHQIPYLAELLGEGSFDYGVLGTLTVRRDTRPNLVYREL